MSSRTNVRAPSSTRKSQPDRGVHTHNRVVQTTDTRVGTTTAATSVTRSAPAKPKAVKPQTSAKRDIVSNIADDGAQRAIVAATAGSSSNVVKRDTRDTRDNRDNRDNRDTRDNRDNRNVGDEYPLERQIGKGSFGYVYMGKNPKTGEFFACKAEKISTSNKDRLRAEYNLYKIFGKHKVRCIPRVDTYLVTADWNLMMMQLLGQSLDAIFTDNNNQLDLGTVMKIGLMMIDGLEEIHKTGVIHRDIKPNNFMFGRREEGDDTKLYIVDFGLSKLWRDPKTGHITQKQGRSMIGTARYASIHVHLGIEPSRRDDLESMGYVLVYLAKGRLPWQGMAKRKRGSSIDEIKDKKMSTTTDELCIGLPSCFKELINYAKSLSFQEEPDYNAMRRMIVNSAKKDSIEMVLAWEDEDYYDNLNRAD